MKPTLRNCYRRYRNDGMNRPRALFYGWLLWQTASDESVKLIDEDPDRWRSE